MIATGQREAGFRDRRHEPPIVIHANVNQPAGFDVLG